MNLKIKKGDVVCVIAGKDKNAKGKVLLVDRKKNRVLIEGVNLIKKHQKHSAQNPQSGIVEREALIDASNVMYIHNGKPTRLGYKVEVVDGKNVKKRIAKTTGEVID